MKVNLKIETPNKRDNAEATKLFRELGYPHLFADEMFVYATSSIANTIRTVSFDELRELARPKEYLNDKFELVVTNQPDDGWILVPDGAECYAFQRNEHETPFFYKKISVGLSFYACDKSWTNSSSKHFGNLEEILWQRENKVESKGRFLHQWAYEAFGRGEDVQFKLTNHSDNQWKTLSTHSTFEKFNENQYEFRLKPQTIQIGSRTINKPISVKPEMGQVYFISNITGPTKYGEHTWCDDELDNLWLKRNLLHLTKEDAISHCDALLELMK